MAVAVSFMLGWLVAARVASVQVTVVAPANGATIDGSAPVVFKAPVGAAKLEMTAHTGQS